MSQPYVYEVYISYCDKAVTMVWLDESCFGLSYPYLSAKSGFEISWFLRKNIIFWISQTWLENVTKCSLKYPLVSYLHMLKSSLELWSLYVWHIQMWENYLLEWFVEKMYLHSLILWITHLAQGPLKSVQYTTTSMYRAWIRSKKTLTENHREERKTNKYGQAPRRTWKDDSLHWKL